MAGYLEIKTGNSYPVYDLQMSAGVWLINHGTSEGLEFTDEGHTYRVGDEILKSITQIPKLAGMTSFRPGMEWFMDRGTALHKATELHDLGKLDEDSVDPEIRGELDAYKKFRQESGVAIRSIETRLWCPKYRFAGCLDRIIEGPTSYKLFLKKNGTYRLKEYIPNGTDWQYFLSALLLIGDNHHGVGKDIARLNVENWIKKNGGK